MKDYIEQLEVEYKTILGKPVCKVNETDFQNYYQAVAKIGSEIIDKAKRMMNFEKGLRNALSNIDDLEKRKIVLYSFKNTSTDSDELMIVNKLLKGVEMQ